MLDYDTLITPSPIKLSIGTLRKPKLLEISNMGFSKFDSYKILLKLSSDMVDNKIKESLGLNPNSEDAIKIYDIIKLDESLREAYLDMFNFFFEEKTIYSDGYFFTLKSNENKELTELTTDDIKGIIGVENFEEVLFAIQQTCCIASKEKKEKPKFKNEKARKLYERMQKSKSMNNNDLNSLSLPNIISAVSNFHPSLNPINIYDITVFQLYDSFNRLQLGEAYWMNKMRVSVWGDEKGKFKSSLWYDYLGK